MAGLELDNVTKIYRMRGKEPVLAVDRLDMAVGDGEIVGLLGSSGCGKTSTLRMIAGFEDATAGTIRLGERAIDRLPPARRNIAMAFEGYALYPPLRVRENIGFALLRGRHPRGEVERRVGQVAEMLEITDILDRYPPTISSGQQQRTSLARALIRDADLHLLDEPMSQLEPQLRAILRARIKDWLTGRRMTTVFVTHDQTEAVALADRIAVMEQGVLQQFGTPAELRDRPANLFVAGFIGEPPMNLYPAEIVADGGGPAIAVQSAAGAAAFRVPLPPADAAPALHERLTPGQQVHFGIRPHKVRLGTGDLSGTVLSNRWLGDQSHIGIDIGGCLLTAVTPDPVPGGADGTIAVDLPAAAINLFDAEDGRALFHGLQEAGP